MELTLRCGKVREPDEIDPALRAALGNTYHGCIIQGSDVRLVLDDRASLDEQYLAKRTFAMVEVALDPESPAPSARFRIKRQAFRQQMKGLDIATLRQRAKDANSVPALRAEVDALWRIIGQMAVLLGLNDSEIGDDA